MWPVGISAKTEAPYIFFKICVQCGPLFLLWENVRACGPKFWNNEQKDTDIKFGNLIPFPSNPKLSMVFSFHVSIPTATKLITELYPTFTQNSIFLSLFLSDCVCCVGNSNSLILTDSHWNGFPTEAFLCGCDCGVHFRWRRRSEYPVDSGRSVRAGDGAVRRKLTWQRRGFARLRSQG